MTKYITLLRGINISGKNKIKMSELKKSFEKLEFENVKTYINSGNIIFDSAKDNKEELTEKISIMIKETFNLTIPIIVLTMEKLKNILDNYPNWDNFKEIYNNIIFIIPPTTFEEVYKEIGEPKLEYENIKNYENVVYWSFYLKDYSKTNWIKTSSSSINNKVTIRTLNTIKKLYMLCEERIM